jgi:hypothetical protein
MKKKNEGATAIKKKNEGAMAIRNENEGSTAIKNEDGGPAAISKWQSERAQELRLCAMRRGNADPGPTSYSELLGYKNEERGHRAQRPRSDTQHATQHAKRGGRGECGR